MKKQPKKNIQTEWDLSYLYASIDDPKLEQDMQEFEKRRASFGKKYAKNTAFTINASALVKALKDFEALPVCTPVYYLNNMQSVDTGNTKISAKLVQYEERLTHSVEMVRSFILKLSAISKKQQQAFLKDSRLKEYAQYLTAIFDRARFNLSEDEERILGRLKEPARSMWQTGFKKILSKQVVEYKKKKLPLSEALSLVPELPRKERMSLHKKIIAILQELAPIAEIELNAIYTHDKIADELRGAKTPYERTVVAYQNDPKAIDTLTTTVTDHFTISHRYYKLKAKLLKLTKLHASDRNVSIGKIDQKYSFTESCDLVRPGIEAFDPQCAEWFDGYLKDGRIDVYPKKGKQGGAYCSSLYGKGSVVFLNHTNDFSSVRTLAHELGHAFHSEYSYGTQSRLNASYTTSVAEVASTFFENVYFDRVFKTLSPKDQVIALHDRIGDAMNTIFRQVAFFNLEKDLRVSVQEDGYVSHEKFAEISLSHLKSYVGPVYSADKSDGYYFMYVPHFRYSFYTYAYAYGALISRALYEKYVSGELTSDQVKEVFKAGSSKSPEEIFASVGINTKDKKFWEAGLAAIEQDIDRLETLLKKGKKK